MERKKWNPPLVMAFFAFSIAGLLPVDAFLFYFPPPDTYNHFFPPPPPPPPPTTTTPPPSTMKYPHHSGGYGYHSPPGGSYHNSASVENGYVWEEDYPVYPSKAKTTAAPTTTTTATTTTTTTTTTPKPTTTMKYPHFGGYGIYNYDFPPTDSLYHPEPWASDYVLEEEYGGYPTKPTSTVATTTTPKPTTSTTSKPTTSTMAYPDHDSYEYNFPPRGSYYNSAPWQSEYDWEEKPAGYPKMPKTTEATTTTPKPTTTTTPPATKTSPTTPPPPTTPSPTKSTGKYIYSSVAYNPYGENAGYRRPYDFSAPYGSYMQPYSPPFKKYRRRRPHPHRNRQRPYSRRRPNRPLPSGESYSNDPGMNEKPSSNPMMKPTELPLSNNKMQTLVTGVNDNSRSSGYLRYRIPLTEYGDYGENSKYRYTPPPPTTTAEMPQKSSKDMSFSSDVPPAKNSPQKDLHIGQVDNGSPATVSQLPIDPLASAHKSTGYLKYPAVYAAIPVFAGPQYIPQVPYISPLNAPLPWPNQYLSNQSTNSIPGFLPLQVNVTSVVLPTDESKSNALHSDYGLTPSLYPLLNSTVSPTNQVIQSRSFSISPLESSSDLNDSSRIIPVPSKFLLPPFEEVNGRPSQQQRIKQNSSHMHGIYDFEIVKSSNFEISVPIHIPLPKNPWNYQSRLQNEEFRRSSRFLESFVPFNPNRHSSPQYARRESSEIIRLLRVKRGTLDWLRDTPEGKLRQRFGLKYRNIRRRSRSTHDDTNIRVNDQFPTANDRYQQAENRQDTEIQDEKSQPPYPPIRPVPPLFTYNHQKKSIPPYPSRINPEEKDVYGEEKVWNLRDNLWYPGLEKSGARALTSHSIHYLASAAKAFSATARPIQKNEELL